MSYLIVNAARSAGTIRKTIYGQFSEHLGRCIYGGIADQDGALRPAVLQALKTLHIPVLRWPGGCFADTYDTRYVQSSSSTFSLLRTTVDEGKNLHAFSDIEESDSFWSVQLVSAGT